MNEQAARVFAIRAAALARGDLALVRECDIMLGGPPGPEFETCEPAPVELAVRRGPGRPRKTER